MKWIRLLIIFMIFGMFLIGVASYDKLPDKVASHWNVEGEVDGTMEKFWGVFLIPTITLFLYGIFLLIPQIDPLKKNISEFKDYYDKFILVFIFFMAYINAGMMAFNLGYSFNMTLLIIPAVSILLYIAGGMMENSKRNFFIGFRTPWTLSSDIVWDKTNQLGGRIFKKFSIIFLLVIFVPTLLTQLIIGLLLIVVLGLVVYSYKEYKKVEKK